MSEERVEAEGKRQSSSWEKKDVGVMETQEGQVGGELEANGKETARTHQKVVDKRHSAAKC